MKKILTVAGALILALTFALSGSPAQAYGWAPAPRCQTQSGNGAKVCVWIHTIPRGAGLRIDQVQLCAYKVDNVYGNHFRGVKDNVITLKGSGGNNLGSWPLYDTDASDAGTCSYMGMALDGGNQSCFTAHGTLNLSLYPDESWTVSGAALGGAC